MKYLITGGAGFIGSYLAEELVRKGNKVTVIDNLSTGRKDNIIHLEDNPNFEFIQADTRYKDKIEEFIKECDMIFHLAASVGVKKIMQEPIESIINNINSTVVLLDLANKYKKKILIASSSEIYGKSDKVPFKETDDIILGKTSITRWCYSNSKAIDEFLALAYHKKYGLPVILVRLFNVIGPKQVSSYGMVVPNFIEKALKNEPLIVHGDGQQTRCFAFIEDICEALVKLANCERAVGEVVNLGSYEEIKIIDLAKNIIEMTNSKSEIVFEDYPASMEDMRRRVPNLGKIKDFIGYESKTELDESLNRIIESATNN